MKMENIQGKVTCWFQRSDLAQKQSMVTECIGDPSDSPSTTPSVLPHPAAKLIPDVISTPARPGVTEHVGASSLLGTPYSSIALDCDY